MPTITRDACPLCQERKSRTLWSVEGDDLIELAGAKPFGNERMAELIARHFAGSSFNYAHCPACGFIYQDMILDSEGMAEMYGLAPLLDPKEAGRAQQMRSNRYRGYRLAMRVLRTLSTVSDNPTKLRVLDFGCGWGLWGGCALALGAEVHGFDLGPRRREASIARGLQVYDSIDAIPGEFDVINTDQVIEHVPNPRKTVEALAKMLKPGGVLQISVPRGRAALKHAKLGAIKSPRDALEPFQHINTFTNKTLRKLGASAGLVPIMPRASLGDRRGFLGMLKNYLAAPLEFRGKTRLCFRKAKHPQ